MHEGQLHDGSASEVVECDVCIVGAGIAGLNAVFASSRRSPSAKVVLLDRRLGPAGMWNDVYEYVQLHQPHPIFTAGNIAWAGQPDPHHLARKREVVDHLRHCFDVLRQRTQLSPRFGYEYLSHDESSGSGSRGAVTVHCRRIADAATLTIRARQLVKAFGYNVPTLPALPLSSRAVRSISPDTIDLHGPELLESNGPIYIVGGGKTGMDTAHTLLRAFPHRKVRMLVGAGTMFLSRDITSPQGLRRHWGGKTSLEVFMDVAGRFDGRNEQTVMGHFRRHYGVSLDDQCRRFMFGIMSVHENREIKRGLDEVIRDHLEDVIDGPNGPTLVLRSGQRRPVEPDAVFINTTGYLVRQETPYEPYLSASGNVLSIQPTSAIHFLSSQSSYFLTHLFLGGNLRAVPLYEVDTHALWRASRDVFPAAAITFTLYNALALIKHLPRWVMSENGLDPMLLFPKHRRLLALAKLLRFQSRHPSGLRDALDVVRERFQIRLGPLSSSHA